MDESFATIEPAGLLKRLKGPGDTTLAEVKRVIIGMAATRPMGVIRTHGR
jgi:hypothetical protein